MILLILMLWPLRSFVLAVCASSGSREVTLISRDICFTINCICGKVPRLSLCRTAPMTTLSSFVRRPAPGPAGSVWRAAPGAAA
jgi:hypothetical protein